MSLLWFMGIYWIVDGVFSYVAVIGKSGSGRSTLIDVLPRDKAHSVAQELERAFVGSALNTTIMAEAFAAGQSLTRGILQLFQGFLALGLLVGIAGLGVIRSEGKINSPFTQGRIGGIGGNWEELGEVYLSLTHLNFFKIILSSPLFPSVPLCSPQLPSAPLISEGAANG